METSEHKIVDGVELFEKEPGVWLPEYGCTDHGKAFVSIIKDMLDFKASNQQRTDKEREDAAEKFHERFKEAQDAWYDDRATVLTDDLMHAYLGFLVLPPPIQRILVRQGTELASNPRMMLKTMLEGMQK